MYPSIEKLAVAANVNRKTAGRALEEAVVLGWLRRWPRGDGYQYQAAVPTEWLKAHQKLRAWEIDPKYISERTRRGRTASARVHAEGADDGLTNVHVADADSPCPDAASSVSGIPTVHAVRPPTNPMTRSVINTKTSESVIGNLDEIARGRGWLARMQPTTEMPAATDPCDKVKRLVAMLADAKMPFDLMDDAVIPEVMRMCGLNSEDAAKAVHRLRDEAVASMPEAAQEVCTS